MRANVGAEGGRPVGAGDRSTVQSLNRSTTQSLAALAKAIGLSPRPGWEAVTLSGVTQDSRQVRPGYLFVAIKGFVSDGHRFIADAISRGAIAVVGEEDVACPVPFIRVADGRIALAQLAAAFFSHPTRDLFTIGVTGTNGKTTVCHLVAHLLGEEESVVVSTVSNEARGLHAVTTPESPIVQQIAADARAAERKNLILEASSAGLALHRVDGVDFDVAVFTNLTHDHYDFHSDRVGYMRAKLLLFQHLKPSAQAIINADAPVAAQFTAAARGKVVTYSIDRQAAFRATDIEQRLESTRFTIVHEHERVSVRIALPGEHNVYNALAAVAVASAAGMTLAEAVGRLATARSVDGRYQFFKAINGASVIIDFAHSPDSLEKMLRSLRPYFKRVICVFGCGGESDRDKRPIMGRISGELADVSILTTDNPKSEDPQQIIAAIASGIPAGSKYERILDRKEAIVRAIEVAQPNDVILIAGKGHEPYQIVGHEFVPYNDVQFLRSSRLVI